MFWARVEGSRFRIDRVYGIKGSGCLGFRMLCRHAQPYAGTSCEDLRTRVGHNEGLTV